MQTFPERTSKPSNSQTAGCRKWSVMAGTALVALLMPFSPKAELIQTDQWLDGVKYVLDTDTRTARAIDYKSDRVEITIPSTIRYSNWDYTVTSISGPGDMHGYSLESLTLPDTATEIFSNAFKGATALKSINFGSGITTIGEYAFSETGLVSVELPVALTSLGNYAFTMSNSLEEAFIPDEAPVTIGDRVFMDCEGLREVYIGKSAVSYGEEVLSGCSALETLHYNAANLDFTGWVRMRGLTWRSELQNIIIGDDVITIPAGLCAGTPSLKTMTMGKNVTTLESGCFSGCTSLEEVTIGESVSSLGESCFSDCSGVKTVYYNSTKYDGGDNSLGSLKNYGLTNVEAIIFAEDVTIIPAYLCQHNYSLSRVELPSQLEKIGDFAFQECIITELDFPETLTEIGESAFQSNKMTSLYIPKNVKKIGAYAFAGSRYADYAPLQTLNISDEAPVEIGRRAFDYVELKDIYIGKATVSISESAFYNLKKAENFIYNAVDCKVSTQTDIEGYENNGVIDRVKNIVIGEDVKNVPAFMFKTTAGVEEITIGSAVENIGRSAFRISDSDNDSYLYFNAESCNPIVGGDGSFISMIESTKIKSLVIGEGVKSIPDQMFSHGASLTEVKISDSVETIGEYAFYYNHSLENIVIPDNVKEIGVGCFSNCKLKEVTLGNGLTSIKESTFANNLLQSISIPDGIEAIEDNAFYNCWELADISFGKGLTYIGENVFLYCRIEKVSVPSIEDWLQIEFATYNSNPTSTAKNLYFGDSPARRITIPEGVEKIHSYAFYQCQELINVTMPSTVKEIGEMAFAGCDKLQKIIFPSEEATFGVYYDSEQNLPTYQNGGTIYIGDETLDREEYTVPEWMTEIPNYAFYNCSKLTDIKMHEGVKTIGKNAFYGCHLQDVAFPESIVKIGEDAFSFYEGTVYISDPNKWAQIEFMNTYSNPLIFAYTFSITEKTEPVHHLVIEDVDHISSYAFIHANNLNSVWIKGSKSIGTQAFNTTYNLNNICIDTEEIGESAFYIRNNSWEPIAIYCINAEPPVAPDNAFSSYENAILYVPEGSVDLYEGAATCWWQFLDIRESDFADLETLFAPDYATGIQFLPNDASYDIEGEDALYYTLQGVRVSAERLEPGIYVRREGGKATKVIVK